MRCPRIKGFRFPFRQSSARNSSLPLQRDWKRIGNAIGNRGVAPEYLLQGFIVCCSLRLCVLRETGSASKPERETDATTHITAAWERMLIDSVVSGPATTSRCALTCWMKPCGRTYVPCWRILRRIEREYQRRLKRESGRKRKRVEHLQAGFRRSSAASRVWSMPTKTGFWKRATSSCAFVDHVTAWPHWRRRRRSKPTRNRSAPNCDWSSVNYRNSSTRIKSGLHDADWSTRREIIRALVKRVEVDEDPGPCDI